MVLDCKSSEKLHRGFESHPLQGSTFINKQNKMCLIRPINSNEVENNLIILLYK